MHLTIDLLISNIHQTSVSVVDRPTKKVKTEPITRIISTAASLTCRTMQQVAMTVTASHPISGNSAPASGVATGIQVTSQQASSGHAASAGTSASQGHRDISGHHSNANLPSELMVGGRWRNYIMPTLILWAGDSDDIWSITRGALGFVLPLIVNTHSVLDSSTMDFSMQSPIVSVVCTL